MAAGQHNPSRRALLGAAVALPLLGAGDLVFPPADRPLHQPSPSARAGSPPHSREELAWARALDVYEAAEEDVREAEAWPADFEGEYGERLDSLCDSVRRLLRTPAPDLRALALKIDLAIEHELGTLNGSEACLAALRRDARRFAGA